MLLKYEDFFQKILSDSNIEFKNFVSETSRDGEWSISANIFSLCFVFERAIFSYNESNLKEEIIIRYKFYPFSQALKRSNEPILIGFSKKHFFPLLRAGETANLDKKRILEINEIDLETTQLEDFI
jgi:hypothetical protein